FRHRAGVTPYTSSFDFAESCVLVKQSLGPLRCGSFSRALLLANLRSLFAEFLGNSSLAHLRILSLPTCVGFGTGRMDIIARSFSWKLASCASLLAETFAYLSRSASRARILPCT